MAYTMQQVRDILTGTDERYAQYLTNGQLRHFKAGVNAAWRDGYDLERDERAYEAKHGSRAADAFSDGFAYSAAWL